MHSGLFTRLLPILGLLALLLTACSDPVGAEGDDGGGCTLSPLPYHDAPTLRGDVRDVHDPAIIRQGSAYYLFSTGHGIPIRRSSNLIDWTLVGRVFEQTDVPGWAETMIPGVEFPWAPDVSFFNGRFHLYYSISTFGSQRSAIGLATNPTLDRTRPDYRWTDHGAVLESRPGLDDFNAIDPNVAFDASGQPWLAWGSFWGGIRLRRIDPATGFLAPQDETVHAIAARPQASAIEAPFIVRRGDAFYQFVAFDSCCQGANSTYRVMVGRAEHITGPYLDRSGRAMMEGGGTPVLEGYGRIRGPGHPAILSENGHFYLVHHFYDAEDGGVPKLQIRPLLWDAEGWPLAGEPYAGGAFPVAETPPDVVGTWGHAVGALPPFQITLTADGRIERCNGGGTWSLDGQTLTLRWTDADGAAASTEVVMVSPEGTWYVGRADDGTLIRGARP